MSILCFGLSHQTAAVDVRERFAIPESALPEALARLKTVPGLTEGLIVSTCNRTEFYVTGEFRDSSAPAFFESFYRDFRAGDETHLFRLWANHRVRHLFQVASGLESMRKSTMKFTIKSSHKLLFKISIQEARLKDKRRLR
jgi:glutamyl-tRNA reductase